MIEWEPDVEYYRVDDSSRLAAVSLPHEELPLCLLAGQDSLIRYLSTNERTVVMRVLGFSATSPMVQAVISQNDGREVIRKGELVSCRHPEDGEVIAGVLRTNHQPILREIGRSGGMSTLPTPIKGLRTERPSSKF
jgi:hypothetical protein